MRPPSTGIDSSPISSANALTPPGATAASLLPGKPAATASDFSTHRASVRPSMLFKCRHLTNMLCRQSTLPANESSSMDSEEPLTDGEYAISGSRWPVAEVNAILPWLRCSSLSITDPISGAVSTFSGIPYSQIPVPEKPATTRSPYALAVGAIVGEGILNRRETGGLRKYVTPVLVSSVRTARYDCNVWSKANNQFPSPSTCD